MMHCRICLVSLVALSVVGCRSGGPPDAYKPQPVEKIPVATISAGNEKSLMPLDIGNEWTYTVEAGGVSTTGEKKTVSFELRWKVVDSVKTPNGDKITIAVTRNGKVEDRQIWLVNAKGFYQLSTGNPLKHFSAPQPVLEFPVSEGRTFAWKGSGPSALGMGKMDVENKILAVQEVDTEVGRLSAIPIESHTSIDTGEFKGRTTSTLWLTPSIGIVRFRTEASHPNGVSVVLLRLKSSSLKKS